MPVYEPTNDAKANPTPLDELVDGAAHACRQAEHACPRRGPGRRPRVPDWVLAALIVVAVLLKKKTKSAQYSWWRQRPADFARWFPGQPCPGRSTFFDRYRRVHRLYQQAIRLQGQAAVDDGWADAACVAVDKTLVAGRDGDPDLTWGISGHDGWVHGYSFEVVVTAPASGLAWPLLASADTASRSEQKSFVAKVPDLPAQTVWVLADAGYDSNAVGEAVEWLAGRRTGKRFLCPEVPRPNTGKPRRPGSRQSRSRRRHRRLRDGRRRYRESSRGRRLYARRKVRVEPFFGQLKHLFELEERVWHRGLGNNGTLLLAAVCAYQVLLTYNHQKGKRNAHLQALLDAL